MVNNRLRVGLGVAGLAVAVAVALMPMGSAWAGSNKHHKHKAKTGVAACPSAASLSAAAGTTYSAPTTEKAYQKGWAVCDYATGGMTGALTISLFTSGYPLREVDANSAGTPIPIHGIGNGASHYNTDVYVQRNSAPSFSVIDQSSVLTLSQTEAIAKAIVKG